MSEEMRETVEVLRLGSDLLLKIGAMSLKVLQKIVVWIYKMRLDSGGEKNYKNLQKHCRERNVPVTFVNFQTEDPELLDVARRNMKKLNIQYAQLPDEIKGDGKTQFMVPADQVESFNKVSESIYEMELKNSCRENRASRMNKRTVEIIDSDKAVDAVMPDSSYNMIRNDMLANAKTPSTPSEEIVKAAEHREYRRQLSNNENYAVKSINKAKLLDNESADGYTIKIPGRQDAYFKLDKMHCLEEDKKTMVIALHKDAPYSIYKKDGTHKYDIKGNDIIKNFTRPWSIESGMLHEKTKAAVKPQIPKRKGR